MTDFAYPSIDDPCAGAAYLFDLLEVDGVTGLRYHGGNTVIAGPVTVTFTRTTVIVEFIDRWSDTINVSFATLGRSSITFGAVVDIVAALATRLAVTP